MSQPPSPNRRIINLRIHPRTSTPPGALFSFSRIMAPVQSGENAEGEGMISDLSLGGCRLLSQVPLEIGGRYNLILQMSNGSAPINVDMAVVQWKDGHMYGLKFISLQPLHESRLRELLLDIRHPAP